MRAEIRDKQTKPGEKRLRIFLLTKGKLEWRENPEKLKRDNTWEEKKWTMESPKKMREGENQKRKREGGKFRKERRKWSCGDPKL